MNNKNVTEENPQGVKYPYAVTAEGRLVSAISIDKNDPKWEGERFFFLGCEGDDEEEMQFVQRKQTKYFRHRAGYLGDRSDPDRLLHNYAELRIKQRFDESEESGFFPVKYYVVKECPNNNATCKLRLKTECSGRPRAELKTINLRELYDTCVREKGEDKYIADLLLTNSKDKSVRPMFLEVFVTHRCSEEKTNSGNRIIEIKINKEEDAENEIVENAGKIIEEFQFMKLDGETDAPPIVFYGFNRDKDFEEYVQYVNFTLTKDGDDLKGDCRIVKCTEVKNFKPDKEVFSLSVPVKEANKHDFYELGMALAYHKGIPVRDCTLCKYYRSCLLLNLSYSYKDQRGNKQIIANPHIFQLPYRCNGFDKTIEAKGCHDYIPDEKRISLIVKKIENLHKEVWKDNSFLQTNEIEELDKTIQEQDKEQEQTDDLIPLNVCRSLCPLNKWDCGFCGEYTDKRDGVVFIKCNNPDKSVINDSSSDQKPSGFMFKQRNDCPF